MTYKMIQAALCSTLLIGPLFCHLFHGRNGLFLVRPTALQYLGGTKCQVTLQISVSPGPQGKELSQVYPVNQKTSCVFCAAESQHICFTDAEGRMWEDGALGAPFLLEDPENQFLHFRRHIYLQNYWDPGHSLKMWENALADQAYETWTALRTAAQYYRNGNTFTSDMSAAR